MTAEDSLLRSRVGDPQVGDAECLPPTPAPFGWGLSLLEALHLPRTPSTQARDVLGWVGEAGTVQGGLENVHGPPPPIVRLAFSTEESGLRACAGPTPGSVFSGKLTPGSAHVKGRILCPRRPRQKALHLLRVTSSPAAIYVGARFTLSFGA